MVSFDEWSNTNPEEVNGHRLRLLTLKAGQKVVAEDKVAAVVPNHYTLGDILAELGQKDSANYLRTKLPPGKSLQSGDLGEIFATEYIREKMGFDVPINKLRFRVNPKIPLPGEDVIGFQFSDNGDLLRVLKVEAKSQARLSASTVRKARNALDKDDGLPAPNALPFVIDMLRIGGETKMSTALIKAQVEKNITPDQVEHLIFVFSGENLDKPLRAGLNGYRGRILQNAVGLKIGNHQEFIKNVFNKALGI